MPNGESQGPGNLCPGSLPTPVHTSDSFRGPCPYWRSGRRNRHVWRGKQIACNHHADTRLRSIPANVARFRHSQGPSRCEVSCLDRTASRKGDSPHGVVLTTSNALCGEFIVGNGPCIEMV